MARFGRRQVVLGAALGWVIYAVSTGPCRVAPGWVVVGLGAVSVAAMMAAVVAAVRMLWVQSSRDQPRGLVLGLAIGWRLR